MSGRVVSVNVAHVTDTPPPLGRPDAKPRRTGIDKRPVTGPVQVGRLGLAGDAILDTAHHGGETQAVYAYAVEDLAWFAALVERDLVPGNFGENLTVEGVDTTEARIGERWKVGASLVLEVTAPRTPCSTFSSFLGLAGWVRTFAAAERPGAYLRVVTPGPVTAGDAVVVVRQGGGASLREVFAAHYHR